MDFPKWMYRKGDGIAAYFASEDHFKNMKDKHLWQDEPWRKPDKEKFCLSCENLKEQVRSLEEEMELKDEKIKDLEEEIKLKNKALDVINVKKGPK